VRVIMTGRLDWWRWRTRDVGQRHWGSCASIRR